MSQQERNLVNKFAVMLLLLLALVNVAATTCIAESKEQLCGLGSSCKSRFFGIKSMTWRSLHLKLGDDQDAPITTEVAQFVGPLFQRRMADIVINATGTDMGKYPLKKLRQVITNNPVVSGQTKYFHPELRSFSYIHKSYGNAKMETFSELHAMIKKFRHLEKLELDLGGAGPVGDIFFYDIELRHQNTPIFTAIKNPKYLNTLKLNFDNWRDLSCLDLRDFGKVITKSLRHLDLSFSNTNMGCNKLFQLDWTQGVSDYPVPPNCECVTDLPDICELTTISLNFGYATDPLISLSGIDSFVLNLVRQWNTWRPNPIKLSLNLEHNNLSPPQLYSLFTEFFSFVVADAAAGSTKFALKELELNLSGNIRNANEYNYNTILGELFYTTFYSTSHLKRLKLDLSNLDHSNGAEPEMVLLPNLISPANRVEELDLNFYGAGTYSEDLDLGYVMETSLTSNMKSVKLNFSRDAMACVSPGIPKTLTKIAGATFSGATGLKDVDLDFSNVGEFVQAHMDTLQAVLFAGSIKLTTFKLSLAGTSVEIFPEADMKNNAATLKQFKLNISDSEIIPDFEKSLEGCTFSDTQGLFELYTPETGAITVLETFELDYSYATGFAEETDCNVYKFAKQMNNLLRNVITLRNFHLNLEGLVGFEIGSITQMFDLTDAERCIRPLESFALNLKGLTTANLKPIVIDQLISTLAFERKLVHLKLTLSGPQTELLAEINNLFANYYDASASETTLDLDLENARQADIDALVAVLIAVRNPPFYLRLRVPKTITFTDANVRSLKARIPGEVSLLRIH